MYCSTRRVSVYRTLTNNLYHRLKPNKPSVVYHDTRNLLIYGSIKTQCLYYTSTLVSSATSEAVQDDVPELFDCSKENYVTFSEIDRKLFYEQKNTNHFRSLSLIHACLKLGELERANMQLASFRKAYPDIADDLIDIHVHNSFLAAYLEQNPPNLKKCLEHFSRLEKTKVKPNLTTFALLIKGHISLGRLNLMKIFYQEMLKHGFKLDELKQSIYLTDEDLDILFKALDKQIEVPKPVLPAKVLSGEEPETKLLAEEPYDTGLLATQVPGVMMLRETLKSAHSISLDLYAKQLKLEESAVQTAMERFRLESESRGDKLLKLNISPLRKFMLEWKVKLTELISAEQTRLSKLETSSVHFVSDRLFQLLGPEKMALIAIQELLRNYQTDDVFSGSSVGRTVKAIGSSIEAEYHAEQMKVKANRYLLQEREDINNLYSSGKIFAMTMRRIQAKFERERIKSSWIPKWPESGVIRVGATVLGMLIESATFEPPGVEGPLTAFSHSYVMAHGSYHGVVLFDPYIVTLLRNEPTPSIFGPRFLPMLVLPKPWLTYNSGGFLTARLRCMRCKDTFEQIVYLKRADELGHLTTVLTSLDVLGSIPWRINNNILEIVKHVWNTGESFAEIPPAHTKIVYPPQPEDYHTDPISRRQHLTKCRELDSSVRNNHSMRCDVNYKVEIANAFRDHEFYFPHNLDFRGRAYPIPPLFNHLGNDLCRGLLVFAKAKPLGKIGLVWLKIHLANLYGFDKHSFEDRANFTDQHLGEIQDSADFPLDGKRWWLKAEDPWQCLAACQELTSALRSGDPEAFLSSLPIHQDGTCNGLQHYAALGGDLEGARHVNLFDSDKPQDIYSGVLHLVNARIATDAELGLPEAKSLLGQVTRKVIKQTVMTNVYGVTFIGARAQIENQLKEFSSLAGLDISHLAMYLTKLVFSSLGEIFTSAQALQAWLNECAGRISASVPADILLKKPSQDPVSKPTGDKLAETSGNSETDPEAKSEPLLKWKSKKSSKSDLFESPTVIRSKQMTSVVWTTPLGLTIVQPYRKGQPKDISTRLQSVHIKDQELATPVNSRKQRTAFPPNFVHSLDASHMMLTSLAMQKLDLAFASVHDSYWTHACDVDTMNLLIRQEFIKLHSQPILENLLKEFQTRYKGFKRKVLISKNPLPKPPTSSGLDVSLLLDNETESSIDPNPENSPVNCVTLSKGTAWIDLEFPPLPARGTFDITHVADSKYFFH